MRKTAIVVAICAALLAAPALAQKVTPDGTPARIRGTVERLAGLDLTVKTRDGHELTIAMAPNYAVSALVRKTPADIKPNDYIASTGIKGTDGKLHCVELRILPDSMRGVAEGQFPWDSMPAATMTNATVTGIATAANGETVKVKFKGEESEFVMGPDCAVYGYVRGDPSLLKPGAAVFLVALKESDGSFSASRVTAEKDGIKPPM